MKIKKYLSTLSFAVLGMAALGFVAGCVYAPPPGYYYSSPRYYYTSCSYPYGSCYYSGYYTTPQYYYSRYPYYNY
jgi:hypothetical protein